MTFHPSAIRQGDVLIMACREIPKTAKAVAPEGGLVTVAYGEATGHHHSFPHRPGVTLFRDNGAGSGGAMYLKVDEPAALTHQEHDQLTVQPGTYRVVIQRRYLAGMAVRVAD
jgi:hypothetical protein